tara:strand:- start:694 stop:879 length:186 start_codon:yes stop_codon:yes gene_type:complete
VVSVHIAERTALTQWITSSLLLVEAVLFEATFYQPVDLAITIKDLSHVGGHGLDVKTFTAR